MNLKYYKNLDGIRAVAAIMVMVFHFFYSIKSESFGLKLISKLSVFGQTGVTLFFVLSGFLITRILLNTKNSEAYFKNFYIRRALRIFPLYYLFLFLFYFVLPYLANTKIPSFNQQIYFYIYLQNFAATFNWNAIGPAHFWSLAVEEHFYLFWPLIVYWFSIRSLYRIISIIIISSLLLRVLMLNNEYGVFYFTFTRFDSLAVGALLALLETKKFFRRENSNKLLLFLGVLLIPSVLTWAYFGGEHNFYIQIFKELFLSFIYFCILGYLLCSDGNHLLNKILQAKFLSYSGKISYGLYVYHPLSYFIGEKLFATDFVFFNLVIQIAVTYLMAAISYYYFETPFLHLKKFFEYEKKHIAAHVR